MEETYDRGIGKRDDGDRCRKFVVKIKKRNPAPEIDRAEDMKPHYCCKHCEKVFSSGKALGGHMSSAHVQPGKDYSGKKAKSKTGEKWGSGDHECSVCGKSFPSHKSLYGHMRCHPEREWRGMDPPSVGAAGKRRDSPETWMESEDATNFVVDPVKTWSVKGRRGRWGRPHIVPPLVSKSPQDSEEDINLPSRQQLLRLLKWEPISNEEEVGGDEGSWSRPKNHHMSESAESCSLRSCITNNKKRKWDDHICCPYHVEKTHLQIKRQHVDGKEEEESDTESDTIVEAICFLANAKYITPSAAAAVDVREIKHICNICNKVFPSHQALGGHKSSHTKVKVSILNTVDMGKNDNIGNNNNIVTTHDAKAKATKEVGDGTSIGGGEERVGGVKLLDFDLNIESLDEEEWSCCVEV